MNHRTICLADGRVVHLDDIDYAWASPKTWQVDGAGYVNTSHQIGKKRKHYNLHRLVMEKMLGRPLLGTELVDHINCNKLDNRRANLRLADRSQNNMNRRAGGWGTSSFIGVGYIARPGVAKRWMAYISYDRLKLYAGVYHTQEEAAWMRDQWALALYGEFARLNLDYFPT